MSEEEWGSWIEHNGNGWPVPEGTLVQVVTTMSTGKILRVGCGQSRAAQLGLSKFGSWDWRNSPRAAPVLMYRVRKPRSMALLQQIVRDAKIPRRKKEDA